MRTFLIGAICLSIVSCSKCDSNHNLPNNLFDGAQKFYEQIQEDDTKESFKEITPAILFLRKIVTKEDTIDENKFAQDNVLHWVIKCIKNPIKENFEKVLELNKGKQDFFYDWYSAIYNHLQYKNKFVKIEKNKIVNDTDSNGKYKRFLFSKGDIDTYIDKIKKVNSKENDDKFTVSVPELLNQMFKKNDFALVEHPKYIVVTLEKFPQNLRLQHTDSPESFTGFLGSSVLKFICCFTDDKKGEYYEESDGFQVKIPKFLPDFNLDSLKDKENSKITVLYEFIKVSDKKIQNLKDDD